jgi:hypothetical protein
MCADVGTLQELWLTHGGTRPEVERMVREVVVSFGHMQRGGVLKRVWHERTRWRTVMSTYYWSHKVLLHVLLLCIKHRGHSRSISARYEGERRDVTLGWQWSCPEPGGGFYSLEDLPETLPKWFGHDVSDRAQTRSIFRRYEGER